MIRHGETEANVRRVMAGSLDSPLTEKGRQQALEVRHVLDYTSIKPTRIIHSPLARARDTAVIINEKLSLLMKEESGIAELHAGQWEGRPYEECRDILRGWADPPGGETCKEFLERVRKAQRRILAEPEQTPLIVSHGGVFRALAKLYDIDIHGVRNCVLYEFEPHGKITKFPWQVWRYDTSEESGSGVIRTRVTFVSHDPDSEIA